MLSDSELLQFLRDNTRYEDGWLICTNRWHNKLRVGQKLGKLKRQYYCISVFGRWYKAHRLIFLMFNGYLPEVVDHKDRDKLNNCIDNLRAATKAQNERNRTKYSNNTSGYKGVWLDKRSQKWIAEITVNGKSLKLGTFRTPESAAEAYDSAALKYHADFSCLNSERKQNGN